MDAISSRKVNVVFALMFRQAVCVVVFVMLIKFLLKPKLKVASLMFIIRSAVSLYVAIPYEILHRSLPIISQCSGSLSFHCACRQLHSFNNKYSLKYIYVFFKTREQYSGVRNKMYWRSQIFRNVTQRQ